MAPLGWVINGFPTIDHFLQFDTFYSLWTLIGIFFGYAFGVFMLAMNEVIETPQKFDRQLKVIQSMRLNFFDCLFLSFCAGFGEEFLFRVGIQHWLNPIITAVIFVAIHGYLNPKEKNMLLLGGLLLLFIIALSFAVSVQGIWFCIAAHSSYDFILFRYLSRSGNDLNTY